MMSLSPLQRAAAAVLCIAIAASMTAPTTASPPNPQDEPAATAPTMDDARALQAAGRWEAAAEAWGLIIEAEPDNATAWFNFGYCLHAARRLDAAIEAHKKAATFDDYHGIALYNLGCAYALLERPDEAFEALFASQAAGFRMRGQAEGDSDLDSLRSDPRYEALLAREPAGGMPGRLQQIVGRVQQIIQQQAPQFQQRFSMIAQQVMGQAMHALAQLQQKLAEDERFAPLAEALGELLGGGGPPPGAAPPADAPPAEPAGDAGSLLEQAQRLQGQGNFLDAAAAYAIAAQADPDNPGIWFSLAYCLHAGGHLDEAIEAHKKAATYEPTRGIALYNLACAYSLTEQPDKAMEALHASRAAGFDLTEVIAEDSDLDNLREDPRFQQLLAELEVDY